MRRCTTRCARRSQVWCAVRLRPRPSSTRCRAPTGGSSSSATALVELDAAAACARRNARRRRALGLIVRHGDAAHEIRALASALGVQAVYRQPRRRARLRCSATRRCAARWPTAASPCTPEGPRGVRAQRGADRSAARLTPCSRRTRTPGCEARRTFCAGGLSGGSGIAAALAPPPDDLRGRGAERWASIGFQADQPAPAALAHRRSGCRRDAGRLPVERIDRLRTRRATSRR